MVTTTSLGVTCSARQPGPDRCLQPNVARRTMHSPPPLSSSRARAKGPRARVSRARVYPPPPHSSGAEPKTQRSESPKHHPIYSICALLGSDGGMCARRRSRIRLDDSGLGAGARCKFRHRSRCTCLRRGRRSRRMTVNLRVHLGRGFAQWPHACRVLAG